MYERQKLNEDAEVQACRKKFASKRRMTTGTNDGNQDNGGSAKRCRRVDVSLRHTYFLSSRM